MFAPRTCFAVFPDQRDEHGFIPSVITENEPGHAPLTGNGTAAQPWYWGATYDEAKETCRKENEQAGLSTDDVIEITLSSMRTRTPAAAATPAKLTYEEARDIANGT
jgi:hypothetical protein